MTLIAIASYIIAAGTDRIAAATKTIFIDFTQIPLTTTDQIHNRRATQGRFFLIQMRIRSIVMAYVALQFFHINRTRIVCAIQTVHIKTFTAIDGFVCTSRFGWTLWRWRCSRRWPYIIHDGNVNCRRMHRFVFQFAWQCLCTAIIIVQMWWRCLQSIGTLTEPTQRIRRLVSILKKRTEKKKNQISKQKTIYTNRTKKKKLFFYSFVAQITTTLMTKWMKLM